MTICEDCKKEYWSVDSCTFPYLSIAGKIYSRTAGYDLVHAYNQEFAGSDEKARCDDCGVLINKIHHVGCTLEQCPVCKEALATCECEDIRTCKNF